MSVSGREIGSQPRVEYPGRETTEPGWLATAEDWIDHPWVSCSAPVPSWRSWATADPAKPVSRSTQRLRLSTTRRIRPAPDDMTFPPRDDFDRKLSELNGSHIRGACRLSSAAVRR